MDEVNAPRPINLKTTVKRGKKHYYIDGEEWSSVTTILKDIVNKPALMGWARKMMKESYSEAVANRMMVAHQNLIAGESPESVLNIIGGKTDQDAATIARKKFKGSANFGKETHQLIQDFLTGKQTPIPPHQNQVMTNFHRWFDEQAYTRIMSEVEVVKRSEVSVDGMVVAGIRYAGTIDLIGQNLEGHVTVVDYKTSKRFYPEMAYQVAAYALGYEYTFGKKVDECVVVVLGKESPSITPVKIPDWRTLANAYCGGAHFYYILKHYEKVFAGEADTMADKLGFGINAKPLSQLKSYVKAAMPPVNTDQIAELGKELMQKAIDSQHGPSL